MARDLSSELAAAIKDAAATHKKLNLIGGDSKAFYGREADGVPLYVADHAGIISFEPTELVVTARAGTRLAELEQVLADSGQMLGCEPPHFSASATVGGTVSCGLSGPRRPYAGSVRDFVLGVRMINGHGEILSFGGQVMKNVAGYDVSRLLTGAMGTLGLILDVSLRVLPKPAAEITLVQQHAAEDVLATINRYAGQPYPLSAALYDGEVLYLRLSGAASAVTAAQQALGGDVLDDGAAFWTSVRELTHPFFQSDTPLWRLSLAPAAPLLDLPGYELLDWGGAQRWLYSDADPATIRAAAQQTGGHATLFRGGDRTGEVFQPLHPVLSRLHQNLKRSLDPAGIFNPGRLYPHL